MMSPEPHPGAERALGLLLEGAHLAAADRLAGLIASAAEAIGGREASVMIVDHQQTQLVDLAQGERSVPLEGSVAGRAFRHGTVEEIGTDRGERIFLPMLDGIERVGILGLTVDAADDAFRKSAMHLASLAAELIITKSLYADTFNRAARTRAMSLAAEMQWESIPPLTAGTDRVTIAAMLEPAYEVGGDLFDYSLETGLAEFGIFDAMGHGVGASLCATLAAGAYRNTRRDRGGLAACAEAIEGALWDQFGGDRFITAILAELDTSTGRLRWVNAGHPKPLLLRGGKVVKELSGRSSVPLGLGLADGFPVSEESLEPGDRVLLYTDGIVENRPAGGREQFGLARLEEFLVRADASGEELPETMRRLSRTLLELHGGKLRDDASQMLVEWRGAAAPDTERRATSPAG